MIRPSPSSAQRIDIQALRAVAVLGVVLFHLWPGVVRGGYAGVDVFFVISGFLITSHLLREVAATGRIRLGTFWARRMRRLLPAAYLVGAATLVGILAFVPSGLWRVNLREVVAAALYGENWILAANSVDYLNSENAPSASQHYWSLSVEEQFYLVWPLLILLVAWLARRRGVSRRTLLALVLGGVAVASFVASIITTQVSPGPAYFVTWTRAWEFALGGLVGLAGTALPAGPGRPARVLGWTMLAVVGVVYTESTPFPGWTAAVPAVGTALIIWAGDTRGGPVAERIAASWPVQTIGTLSYSLYLWHWPLIIIGGYASMRATTLPGHLGLLATSVVLAWLTYRFVENPLRAQRWLAVHPSRSLVAGLLAGAVLAGSGLVALHHTTESERRSVQQATELLDRGTPCLGADATLGADQPCVNAALDGVLLPQPSARLSDTGGAYRCYDQDPGATVKDCSFGSKRPDALRVALVGDSHGASLLPGLKDHLAELDWHLDTYVGRGCLWPRDATVCPEHVAAVEKRLVEGKYDLVITTTRRNPDLVAGSPDPAVAVFADAWRRLAATGTRIVAVADDPTLTPSMYACVNGASDADALKGCSMSASQAWHLADPLPAAVKAAGAGVSLVDLSQAYCVKGRCPAVIGHVIAYRDDHHLTATFSRTLAPYLIAAIKQDLD